VPVDYVADSILALGAAPPGTYIVAGEHARSTSRRVLRRGPAAPIDPDHLEAEEIDEDSLTDSQARVLHQAACTSYFRLRVLRGRARAAGSSPRTSACHGLVLRR
jgi:hypothetical protein